MIQSHNNNTILSTPHNRSPPPLLLSSPVVSIPTLDTRILIRWLSKFHPSSLDPRQLLTESSITLVISAAVLCFIQLKVLFNYLFYNHQDAKAPSSCLLVVKRQTKADAILMKPRSTNPRSPRAPFSNSFKQSWSHLNHADDDCTSTISKPLVAEFETPFLLTQSTIEYRRQVAKARGQPEEQCFHQLLNGGVDSTECRRPIRHNPPTCIWLSRSTLLTATLMIALITLVPSIAASSFTWSTYDNDPQQLRRQVPDYIERLHSRHQRFWNDFWQFDRGHLDSGQSAVGAGRRLRRSLTGDKNLGLITAIRHHKHVATLKDRKRDYSSNYRYHPYLYHYKHRLLFRLAELPPNEELVAGSLRIFYQPPTTNDAIEDEFSTMIRKGNGERTVECLRKDQSQWNVMIWLEADQQPDDWTRGEHRRYYTLANFEPSRRNGAGGIKRDCSLFVEHYYDKASGINRSLLHLPEGWFNLPLDRSLLNTINSNTRRHLLSFHVTISGGGVALIPSASALKGLQLISGARSVNQAQLWVNMAPHLLTFHRDNSRLDGGESMTHQMPRPSPPTDNVKIRRVRRSIQFPPQDNDDDSVENEQTPNSLDDQSQSSSFSPLTSNNLTDIPPRRPRKRLRRHLRQSSTASANSAWSHSYQHQPRRRAYHYQKSSSSGGVGSLSNAPFTSPANRRRPLLRPITHQSYLDTSCQRRPLVVKFASIGWAKMVMAPESVDIGHCFGRCPFPLSAHYNATNYAVLLQLAHLYGATPFDGPCCVPYKFTSQSLLLHDKYENVAIQMLNNSIVESCACQ